MNSVQYVELRKAKNELKEIKYFAAKKLCRIHLKKKIGQPKLAFGKGRLLLYNYYEAL